MSNASRQLRGFSRKTPSQSTSRKKSCQNCSDAKARCSLQRPLCSRCSVRGLTCHYSAPDSVSSPMSLHTHDSLDDNGRHTDDSVSFSSESPAEFESGARTSSLPTSESLRIGTRWLDALIPPPGHSPKYFSPRTIQYMSRVLKSYSKMMLRDETLPPIIHPLQSARVPQRPLANCRSLLRLWENKVPGSELIVTETVKREMSRLFEEHRGYDHATLLSACQAYLLYSVHMFFSAGAESTMVDTSVMINLQELASTMSQTILRASEGSNNIRPAWEAWVMAEAKRRTLYTMYMFDNIFNFAHNAPSYIAAELGKLPAPSSKLLWTAANKNEWGSAYDRHVGDWPLGGPLVEDLWPHPDEDVARERRRRTDRWVESVDEFGMLLFAVCALTHGSG
ncbi:hypothetical protein B0H10DRAFT_2120697 [Mycena sp. CBHHK59/15]|nr:hypothetical protein B0H10DRAFT_2120697 [Mycena sp. CBHHK59/15]